MPSSWQARMIRTAISPRLATSTRRNGAGSATPSLRKDVLERDVAMLLSWIRVALVGEDLEGADDPRSRFHRLDDVIDIPARRGRVGTGELGLVGGNEAGA